MADAAAVGADCWINSLPDDLLLRAISGLNARELVQTCVLSRRWRNLWRSVPRINATYHEFNGKAPTEEQCDVLFKKFVNRFLLLRNPVGLDEFRLFYNVPEWPDDIADSEDANLWIGHALSSGARSVEVFSSGTELHLNPAVFASNCSLTSLLLSNVVVIPPFFRSLRMGCRALERLVILDSPIADPDISSHTLKVLIVNGGCHCTFDGKPTISIPSLTHLHFRAAYFV